MVSQCSRKLYVFIDKSNNVFSLIAVEESELTKVASRIAWVRHFKTLRKREKKGFLKAFPRRAQRVHYLLVYVRIFTRLNKLEHFLHSISKGIKVLCIDDEVLRYLESRGFRSEKYNIRVVLESKTRHKVGLRRLMLFTDDLANYARLMLSKGRYKDLEKLVK